jgi:hypothetical protein
LIDQEFIYPEIMPGPPTQYGPRLESFALNQSNEGAPINYILGPRNRTGGTTIYCSDIIEVKNVEEVVVSETLFGRDIMGDVVSYSYFVHIAVALGEGPLAAVTRIWANGKIIYKARQTIVVTDNTFSSTILPAVLGLFQVLQRIHTTAEDLSQFQLLASVNVSGFTDAANNGDFSVVGVGVDGTGEYIDVLNPACTNESAGDTVTLTQTAFNLFSNKHIQAVRFYPGDDTQDPDIFLIVFTLPLFASPAYRGTSYVFLQGLALEDFGNRIPNLSFEVEETSSRKLSEALEMLLQRGGLVAAQYDTSGIPDSLIVRGYIIPGPSSILQSLRLLMKASNIVVRENNGVLEFFQRGSETIFEVDPDSLAAHETGQDAPRPLQITDMAEWNLPSEVNVEFFDTTNMLQKGSQREKKFSAELEIPQVVSMPITMTPAEARDVAARILWSAHANRRPVSFSLPPSFVNLHEHDKILVTVDDITYQIIVTEVDRGNNFLVMCTGVIDLVSSYEYNYSADDAYGGGYVDGDNDDIYYPSHLGAIYLDIPAMTADDAVNPGIYVGTVPYNSDDPWDGASIYRATTDVDSAYSKVLDLIVSSVIGKTASALSTSAPAALYWDRIGTIDVELYRGTLTSRTEMQVLNGMNWALIGSEIIGYQNAALVSGTTYRLSMLLRGLRATTAATHSTNEPFVPLSGTNVHWLPLDAGLISTSPWFRAVAVGGDVDDVDGKQLSFTGKTVTPMPTAWMRGTRDVSDNVTVQWEYRTREIYSMFSSVPPNEIEQNYTLYIYTVADALLRTVTGLTARTFTYTTSMQTSDGATPGDSFKFKAVQVGEFATGTGPTETI